MGAARAIVFLTTQPSVELVRFAREVAAVDTAYDVFICLDDPGALVPSPVGDEDGGHVEVLRIPDGEAKRAGFFGCVMYARRRDCARDKALYCFSRVLTSYSFVWMCEDDVFVPTAHALRDIDAHYPTASLLSQSCEGPFQFREAMRQPWVRSLGRDLFDIRAGFPWYKAMICAIRVSRAYLGALSAFAARRKRLFFDEVLLVTLPRQCGLEVATPDEFADIHYRHDWRLEDLDARKLYHPVKSADDQAAWHRHFRSPSAPLPIPPPALPPVLTPVDVLDRIYTSFEATEGHCGLCVEEPEALANFVRGLPSNARVLEIGFGCGHSAWFMLAARPDVSVVSVDIGRQRYVKAAKDAVDTAFPLRHRLCVGDSAQLVPCLEGFFDMYFVDGGHDGAQVRQDVANCLAKARRAQDLIVLDDVLPEGAPTFPWSEGPTAAWRDVVGNQTVTPLGAATSSAGVQGWVWGLAA